MKKKIRILAALLILIQNSIISNAQLKIANVVLPQSMAAGKEKLVLNGAGIRERYFIDVYVGGLYLLKKKYRSPKHYHCQ